MMRRGKCIITAQGMLQGARAEAVQLSYWCKAGDVDVQHVFEKLAMDFTKSVAPPNILIVMLRYVRVPLLWCTWHIGSEAVRSQTNNNRSGTSEVERRRHS